VVQDPQWFCELALPASVKSLRYVQSLLRMYDVDTVQLQVSHISALNNLSEYYQITYLCHASQEALKQCSRKVNGEPPKTTSNPEELIASPEVDVLLICAANAFHASHAILALQQHKYVLLEKPAALNYRDIDAMILAENKLRGKVFVGYQRRYAEAFLDAVKEVGGMGKIQYARVRGMMIIFFM
jgi:predicted dehydrogenase